MLFWLVQRPQRLRRRLSHRLRSQNMVEFGVSVAAVAFVAVLGMNALTNAQTVYWGGQAQSLAQATPAPGDFIHPTTVTESCSPTSLLATVPTTFTCTATVTDGWTSSRTAPRGTVTILVANNPLPVTCAVVPDPSGQPFSTCPPFAPTWTPQLADVGKPHLSAKFTPDQTLDQGKHAASTSTSFQILTVAAPLNVAFTGDSTHPSAPCWNPETIPGFTAPNQVETGHPLVCHVVVTDPNNGNAPVASTRVQITEAVADQLGTTYMSCYSRNSLARLVLCNPATPGTTLVGVTGDGSLANGPKGELWFVYRRYYDALPATANETLTATLPDYPGNPPSAPQALSVRLPGSPHNADLVQDCPNSPSSVVSSVQTWDAANGQTVTSDHSVSGPAPALVTCTVVVFDTDQPLWNGANPDWEDLYSPAGIVSWTDESGNPILNQAGKPAQCTLDPTLGNVLPAFKQGQYNGLPPDASGCQVTLQLSGNHTVTANYVPTPAPRHGHQAAMSMGHNQFTINFP